MIMSEPNGGPMGPHVFRPRFVTPLYYHSDTDSESGSHSMPADACHLPGIVHSRIHVKVVPGQRRSSEGAVSPAGVNVSLSSQKSQHSLPYGQNQQSLVEIKINSSAPPRAPPRQKRQKMKASSDQPSSEDDKDIIMKPGSNTQNSLGTTTDETSSATLGMVDGGSAATLAIPEVGELSHSGNFSSNWPWSLEDAKKMMRRASHPLDKGSGSGVIQIEPPPPQPPPNGVPAIISTITTSSRSAGPSLSSNRSIGIQVSAARYRLRCMPDCNYTRGSMSLIGRWVVSQFGLAILLTIWAVAGSAVFHASEYPRESRQQKEVDQLQNELSVELSEDLRLIDPTELNWLATIEKSLESHEQKLLAFVADGYAEGSSTGGKIWTFAGCFLFSISLLTTLGFGAPVPRTTAGRVSAVVFAAVGIPLHLILILNVGQLSACLLLSLAARGQRHGLRMPVALIQCCCSRYFTRDIADLRPDTPDIKLVTSMPPRWLKLLPVYCILTYYIFGVLVFGVARSRPATACFLFPLDFTATGGVANTPSSHRVFYALYLEGAMLLAASCASLVQQSTQQGVTDLCLRWGLLTKESP